MKIKLLLEDGTKVKINYTEMGDTTFDFTRWNSSIQSNDNFVITLTDDELRDARIAIQLMEGKKND
jgi:hypothetical protein